MPALRSILVALLLVVPGAAQELVSFPTADGGLIYADLYGTGDHGVVLAHGGRFNKSSWEKQARALAEAGFRALAIAHAQFIFSSDQGERLMRAILRFLSAP